MTLTGPGGIGKTSLAIEAARRLEPRFPDGAWFVSLAALAGPDQVAPTIAHGIGLFDGPERSAASAVLSFLADRSMVLVLDNMEHLLDAADEVAAVVHASPASRVLVTSRAPLRVAGEHEVPVARWSTKARRCSSIAPGPPGSAGSRARTARSSPRSATCWTTSPSASNSPPLASSLLSPAVIRDRLAARLPLPGSGSRDAPDASAHAGGSGRLEPRPPRPGAAGLLHRLAVFEGGFDLEQVDAVVGASAAARRSTRRRSSNSPTRA